MCVYVAPEIPLVNVSGANSDSQQTLGGALGNFMSNWFNRAHRENGS